MTATTRSASSAPSSISFASSLASDTLCNGTLRTSIGSGTDILCHTRSTSAASCPPDSTAYADPGLGHVLAGRGEEVVVMGFAPAARAGHDPGDAAPVVDEAGVADVGRVGDDGTAPVVVVQDRVGDLTTLGEGQPIGVQQEAEPPERLALPGVGDVALIAQRGPVPGGCREIPDDAARAGQVEVDEGRSRAVAEYHVGRVDVVVADQPGGEAGRNAPGPAVPGRVERRCGIVIPAQ